jgi:hypothetical protein
MPSMRWCRCSPATWDAPAVERKVRQHRQYTGGKPTPTQAGDLPDLPEVRRFNATHRIEDELRRAGCTRAHGNRWITPQSTSGQSSLAVNREANHAWAFSPKNPVGRDGKIRPADLALQSDFDGNVEAFLTACALTMPSTLLDSTSSPRSVTLNRCSAPG